MAAEPESSTDLPRAADGVGWKAGYVLLNALEIEAGDDIQPLLDNTGLGAGNFVHLSGTNVSCPDVAALEAKGVTVSSDCP